LIQSNACLNSRLLFLRCSVSGGNNSQVKIHGNM